MILVIGGKVVGKMCVNYTQAYNQEEINKMVAEDYEFMVKKYGHKINTDWEIYLSAESKMNETCKIAQKTYVG